MDGVGEVTGVERDATGGATLTLRIPDRLHRYVVEKGSIAVDGVSLTVASCAGRWCEVALIPHTLAVTVAGEYAPGRPVNLEVDLIARYLARLLEERGVAGREP